MGLWGRAHARSKVNEKRPSASHRRRSSSVFPARAGVVLRSPAGGRRNRRLPRACGGGPSERKGPGFPRVVFPARAGVVRDEGAELSTFTCLPRACGGGPGFGLPWSVRMMSSPRVRGWSCPASPTATARRVFPARAGVVRTPRPTLRRWWRLPRACGGGPWRISATRPFSASSPRVRGWSRAPGELPGSSWVFPARAGVVPTIRRYDSRPDSLPRACGGGPSARIGPPWVARSSPRVRGWSPIAVGVDGRLIVFPARAGVVLCSVSPA